MASIERVVVLGSSGFIGQHLVDQLRTRHRGLDLVRQSLSEVDFADTVSRTEFTNLFDKSTAVVMLSGIKRQFGDNLDVFGKNLQIVENVCEALVDQPVGRLIYFSSAAVYGEDIHNESIDEKTSPEPTSYYGLAKFTGERLLWKACEQNGQTELLCLRPPLVYGPGDPDDTYGPVGFTKKAVRGEEIVTWGDGTELREFMYVRDVADLTARLIVSDAQGVLNLASGASRTFADVLSTLEELGMRHTVSRRERTKSRVDNVFDPSLLLSLVPGYEFTSLSRGINDTLASLTSEEED